MSDREKKFASSIGTFIYRTFIGIAMVMVLKSIPLFIYDVAKWQKDIEERTLSSVEMRIDLERHMKIWTPENQAEAFARLAGTEKAIIELRKMDSISLADRQEMRAILEKIERNTRKN